MAADCDKLWEQNCKQCACAWPSSRAEWGTGPGDNFLSQMFVLELTPVTQPQWQVSACCSMQPVSGLNALPWKLFYICHDSSLLGTEWGGINTRCIYPRTILSVVIHRHPHSESSLYITIMKNLEQFCILLILQLKSPSKLWCLSFEMDSPRATNVYAYHTRHYTELTSVKHIPVHVASLYSLPYRF